MKRLFTLNNFISGFFYLSILIFLIGFNFTDSPPPSGWYQQFMPNIGGKQISDITFLDSLNGYAVATQTSDSSYILKTTNGGNNWQIIYRQLFAMTHVQFLNLNTGYAGGGYLYKTTNGGYNWTQLNTPATTVEMMYVINQDTIFFVNSESLTGGVFLTTNGGVNWTRPFSAGVNNPSKIYMYDRDTGFIEGNGHGLYRTTNGGLNWSLIETNNYAFYKMYFPNSQTGWKCNGFMKKSTNGGLNWTTEALPGGGMIQTNGIWSFSVINKDTIWGNGGYLLYPNNQTRLFLNRTTDGGNIWLFQVPDTAIHINYYYVNFTNKSNGWVTDQAPTEIHTVTGGNDTFYTSVKKLSSNVPEKFELFPNYPNPFNPVTHIKYQLTINGHVELVIYDITGKEVKALVNQKQIEGIYEASFDGSNYSSGVYFYSLIIDGQLIDTKKMILLK